MLDLYMTPPVSSDAPTGDSPATPLLSVVIPAYNEVATIERLVAAVRAVDVDKEIIIVDDASTDGTRERLAELAADGWLRLIEQSPNQGKGAALRAGFAAATGRFVVVQDADLEYDPAEFRKLIQPIVEDQADVVFGSRFIGDNHRVLYFWHTVGNRFLTLLSNAFTDLNLTDMETCYKAFRREVLATIVLEEDRFGIEPGLTAKVAAGGWRIYEVGITYSGRTYAEGKKIGWRDGVRAVACIVRYSPVGERVRARTGR